MTTVKIKHPVPASRMAMGKWCHQTNRQLGEGDIAGAYSADTIAMEGKIRQPFRLDGWLCTTVSIAGNINEPTATAYRLIDFRHYEGTAKTYSQSRQEPRSEQGFYDGITIKHGKRQYVIVGPPIEISVEDALEPLQASLF